MSVWDWRQGWVVADAAELCRASSAGLWSAQPSPTILPIRGHTSNSTSVSGHNSFFPDSPALEFRPLNTETKHPNTINYFLLKAYFCDNFWISPVAWGQGYRKEAEVLFVCFLYFPTLSLWGLILWELTLFSPWQIVLTYFILFYPPIPGSDRRTQSDEGRGG